MICRYKRRIFVTPGSDMGRLIVPTYSVDSLFERMFLFTHVLVAV